MGQQSLSLSHVGLSLALSGALFLAGCGVTQKNRSDAYVPSAQQCVSNSDPACIGEATIGVQTPLPEAGKLADFKRSIMGRCEMVVVGERETRPCQNIKLVVRSAKDGETREANIDGFNFQIQDLSKDNYSLEATSPQYEILTNTKALKPGNNAKVRIKVKPRN